MRQSFLSLPWKIGQPSVPRRVFWQVCAGMPLTGIAFVSGDGSAWAGLAQVGLVIPAVFVVYAYIRAACLRTDAATTFARDTAHAAVYSTLILSTVVAASAAYADAQWPHGPNSYPNPALKR